MKYLKGSVCALLFSLCFFCQAALQLDCPDINRELDGGILSWSGSNGGTLAIDGHEMAVDYALSGTFKYFQDYNGYSYYEAQRFNLMAFVGKSLIGQVTMPYPPVGTYIESKTTSNSSLELYGYLYGYKWNGIYRDNITCFMDEKGQWTVRLTPEPATFILFILGAKLCGRRRHV